MTGRAALVTGAGRRIGKAMAIGLARSGHDVAVHYASSRSGAEETAREIEALGRKAALVQADFLRPESQPGVVARASGALGQPLGVLVNNASIFENDTLETSTRESWDRHLETNLRAAAVLTAEFARQAPRAIADERGEPVAQSCVINMLDQRVRRVTGQFMSYTVAKMGLWALTKSAAIDLAPDIRVNAIGPGPTLRSSGQSEEHFIRQRASTPLRRGADERDIVDAMGYLISARSVTGQLICVDGGQHLGRASLSGR